MAAALFLTSCILSLLFRRATMVSALFLTLIPKSFPLGSTYSKLARAYKLKWKEEKSNNKKNETELVNNLAKCFGISGRYKRKLVRNEDTYRYLKSMLYYVINSTIWSMSHQILYNSQWLARRMSKLLPVLSKFTK